jgi:putative transcriptional regulator
MREARLNNTLKVERAKKDWTQEKLASEIGVTRKTINSIEKGRDEPSIYLALKLAKALGSPIEHLFQLKEDQIWGHSPFE